MQAHLNKILTDAKDQLPALADVPPAERIELYKRFYSINEQGIRTFHNVGRGGKEVAQLRAKLTDTLILYIFELACSLNKFDPNQPGHMLTLIAIGGYGRGELNPFSDIDLLFLYEGKAPNPTKEQQKVIEEVLYLLWDIGFKLGHSTRSIYATLRQANEDMLSKTALTEARRITGSLLLFQKFSSRFYKYCIKEFTEEFTAWRMENQRQRHEKYGGTVFVQEPNIKNGCGGLRDYQSLLWLTFFHFGSLNTLQLVKHQLLRSNERGDLDRAYDFLLRVRTELHYINKRGTDQLTLYYQGIIAENFHYPQDTILRKSEAFMRDYFHHARNIYLISASVADRLSIQAPQQTSSSSVLSLFKRRPPLREEFDGFFSENGLIYFSSKEIFTEDPFRILRVFLHAQNRHLDLSPRLQQFIRRRTHLIDPPFYYAKASRDIFQTILSRKGEVGRILRMMHEVNVLGAYLPEFGGLTCLVQHEFFHRYTADEHTLKVIEQLDQLLNTEDPKLQGYRKLFRAITDPFILYLAALLHDTGRATNAPSHHEASAIFAQKIAKRLQISREQRQRLLFLVDNHTLLSYTAQRRNLDDVTTIAQFASLVQTQEYLDNLMCLTLADGQGTTDSHNWSDWKESLIWQLYNETSAFLHEGRTFHEQREIKLNTTRTNVISQLDHSFDEEIHAHFESMPDHYFRKFAPATIVRHLKLFRRFLLSLQSDAPMAPLIPVFEWTPFPQHGFAEVLVCTWDRNKLLENIACAFSVTGINILSADILTRKDNLVLDVFRVSDPELQTVIHPRDVTKFETTLTRLLTESNLQAKSLIETASPHRQSKLSDSIEFPTRIVITNDTHPIYTLVDIQTPDRLGLLYQILRGFSQAHTSIVFSRISTEKGAAIDSFYITDNSGNKIRSSEAIENLQNILRETLTNKKL